MIQLFLDGKIAITKDNSTIKLTSENQFFTKSATYTYDVELPLDIAENLEIFGHIHRMDVSKVSRILTAELIVDNVTVLLGTAHITAVSETSVKVQLLGAAASYNYGNKMDNTFIDELDLGDWYWETFPDGRYVGLDSEYKESVWLNYPKDWRFTGYTQPILDVLNQDPDNPWWLGNPNDNIYMRALSEIYSGKYNWVAFPTYNATADVYCNKIAYRMHSENPRKTATKCFEWRDGDMDGDVNQYIRSFCPQPYVWRMVEKVAKATGFEIRREDNALYTDPFFKKIFIVSTSNRMECCKCLPHWSVNDWWTQIENTFGVILNFDYTNKRIYISKRNAHYTNQAGTVYLNEIVDEYTTEIDDETETDISVNSVGFTDYENGAEDILSDVILDSAGFISSYQSLTDLLAWAKTVGADGMKRYKNYVWKCADGRHYIYTEAKGLIEVNMFRPRYADEEDEKEQNVDVELKIVPAKFDEGECEVRDYFRSFNSDLLLATFPITQLVVEGKSEMGILQGEGQVIDIESVLGGDEYQKESSNEAPDVMYIAIANLSNVDTYNLTLDLKAGYTIPAQQYTGTFKINRPFLRCRSKAELTGSPTTEDGNESLSLIPIEGETNLASQSISGMKKIGATVRHCIKFIADTIPNPGSIFIIRNRRFVCEKIEANINADGLDRLLTGYFYDYGS